MLAWAHETHGILGRRDRLAFVGQGLLYLLAALPWELRRALGIKRRRLGRIDPSALEPPDSGVCRQAEQLVAEGTSPMVANHSHRTYAWGAVLAAHDGLRYDREVVYVASLLHDLYAEHPTALTYPHCFTLPGADRADELTEAAGWEEHRRHAAAEAITLHANLWPPRDSPESYLVFAGARLDVVGYRYWDLHPDIVRGVLKTPSPARAQAPLRAHLRGAGSRESRLADALHYPLPRRHLVYAPRAVRRVAGAGLSDVTRGHGSFSSAER